jgi:hypothetical protein
MGKVINEYPTYEIKINPKPYILKIFLNINNIVKLLDYRKVQEKDNKNYTFS